MPQPASVLYFHRFHLGAEPTQAHIVFSARVQSVASHLKTRLRRAKGRIKQILHLAKVFKSTSSLQGRARPRSHSALRITSSIIHVSKRRHAQHSTRFDRTRFDLQPHQASSLIPFAVLVLNFCFFASDPLQVFKHKKRPWWNFLLFRLHKMFDWQSNSIRSSSVAVQRSKGQRSNAFPPLNPCRTFAL